MLDAPLTCRWSEECEEVHFLVPNEHEFSSTLEVQSEDTVAVCEGQVVAHRALVSRQG